MKSFFLKPLLIIFGIVLFPFVHPTGSVAQVAEEQFINGDALPDAPELALRGEYKIGVRTIEVIHKNQIDILNVRGGVEPVYDRKLKLEVWYPAALPAGAVDLLTYVNARHNVAPNSPPKESLKPGLPFDFYYHYAEPVWDQRRINNINQHFVTAFLGIQLKKKGYSKYLDFDPNIKTWPGFKPHTSVGLELVHSASLKPE